jgi:hypothetical protein
MNPTKTLPRWLRLLIFIAGWFNTLTGLALLFAPAWFYQNIGNFPPYNRHFLGDAGAFLLPWGIGLLWAARHPAAGRPLIGLAALASLIHALNHAYDDWLIASPLSHWLTETIPLLLFAALLLFIYWQITPDAQ